MLAIGAVEALPVKKAFPAPPVVQSSRKEVYDPVTLARNFRGTVIEAPLASVSPTCGRLVALNPLPMLLDPSGLVVMLV